MAMNADSPKPSAKERMISGLRGLVSMNTSRLDAWVNALTGFGTDRDKTTYGYVLPNRLLTDAELSALYHSDDMAERMVDVVPQEMLREGFSIETGDAKLDATIADKLAQLSLREHLFEGISFGRCYGGAAILLGIDDHRGSEEPLVPERGEDIDFLYTLDRRMLWPVEYYEEPGPNLGKPSHYMVGIYGGRSYRSQIVHESRLVLFGGARTGIQERRQLAGWDLSVLQRAYDVLRSFNSGYKSVETLLVDGAQAVFKMTGLADMMGRDGGEALLRARMQVMDLYRSVVRAMVVDADGKESFERHVAPLTGYGEVLDKMMLRMAAAVQTPVTILMGQSPAGMNATGESDFRWFYDRIRSMQNVSLSPRVRHIVAMWLRTRAGRALARKPPETLAVKFPPLWTETPLVQAQRELAISQRDNTYVQAQVLTPDEVALHRFGSAEGFKNDLRLAPEALAARQTAIDADMARLTGGGDTDAAPNAAALGPDGAPIGGPATEVDPDAEAVELNLTPSDLAAIVKVNEARASVKLDPLPAPDGDMTLPQFKAKYANLIAVAANAEAGTVGEPPEAAAAPAGGGFGGFGGGPSAAEPGGEDGDEDGEEPEAEREEKTTISFGAEDDDDEDGGTKLSFRADALVVEETLAAFDFYFLRAKADTARRRLDAIAARKRLDAGPRPFVLQRDVDETGVSGPGEIAHGCVFSDGKVAVRWKTATASTTLFDSVDDMLKVHGHAGKTRIIYDDGEP